MTTAAAESPTTRWVIAGLSAFVFAAVLVVLYLVPGRPATDGAPVPSALATLNACLNGAATVFLVAGWVFVRSRNIKAHRTCMLTAFGLSSVFLLTYLAHHYQVGSVKFAGEGWVRGVYFAFLIPHIILAAGVVPLALLTIYRGWTNKVQLHKKVARWTLPLWVFVGVSGVIVYWMLYHL